MTYKEIAAFVASIAEALGCGYHYYDEGEKDVSQTHYLLFVYPDRDDTRADDRNYVRVQRLNLEYDSKMKDIDAEAVIEKMLDDADLAYTKEDTRYDGADAYGAMYSTEVIVNG